jgi:hypothetical protein
MLTENVLRNPTNKTALEMDAVAVLFFWNKTLRTRLDKKKDMEAPVKIPVSIVKRMILVIRKCVFLKRGLRSNYHTASVDGLHFAR